MTDQQAGFEIHGRFYPMPTTIKGRDPIVIKEVSGMTFREFAEASDDPSSAFDPGVVITWVAIAVWRANPGWSRATLLGYIGDLDFDAIKGVGANEEEGAPAGPPAPAGEQVLPTSPTALNGSQESHMPPPSPMPSGLPG